MRSTADGDLFTDRLHGDVDAGHQHHGLEAGQGVSGSVGVERRERTVVSGVHGLEHVEGLATAHLADDDAIGPHAQGVAHEIADRDLAASFEVLRASLEPDHVAALQAELDGVFDGDDALAERNEVRQQVEQRRLTGARTAGDEDVQPTLDAFGQEVE